MKSWTAVWGLPGLEDAVDISFSARLKHSLGRCTPATGRIVLSESLRAAHVARVADALCHELAHVAAFVLYGRSVKAHGSEWAQLVHDAGLTPRTHRPVQRASASQVKPIRRRAWMYEHRCPVCQTVRLARRPVTRWRCAECSAAGLPGEMLVTLRATAKPALMRSGGANP